MPNRYAPLEWVPLDGLLARNREAARGRLWRDAAKMLNHTMHRNRRVLFCQHVPLANVSTTAQTPLYRHRYNQNFGHYRELSFRAVALMLPDTATSAATLASGTASLSYLTSAVAPIDENNDTSHVEMQETIVVANAYVNRTINTGGAGTNAFRAIALAIVDRPLATFELSTTDAATAEWLTIATGSKVLDGDIEKIRAAHHNAWLRQRRMFASWSAIGTTAAAAVTSTSTATPGLNLIDGTSGSRTATSGGFHCPAKFASRLNTTSIEARCAVYAQVDDGAGGVPAGGGTGEVRFVSSLGTLAITGITNTAAWYPASTNGLSIDTTASSDKVDIFGRMTAVAGADRLLVWAWMIQEEPS